MGKSKRSVFSRKLEGDVVVQVAESLPDEVALITRSSSTPHLGKPVALPPQDASPKPEPEPEPGPDQQANAGPTDAVRENGEDRG